MKKTYVACSNGCFYREPVLIRKQGYLVFPEMEDVERQAQAYDGLGRLWLGDGEAWRLRGLSAIGDLLNDAFGVDGWKGVKVISDKLDADVPDGSAPPRRLPAVAFTFQLIGSIPEPESFTDEVRYKSRLRQETVLGAQPTAAGGR